MNFDDLFTGAMESLKSTFGETVTYHPGDGSSYSVQAIIDRAQIAEDANGIPVRVITITVSGDAERGIPASLVDTYADMVEAEKIRGSEPSVLSILEVVTASGNTTKLICR